METEKEKRVNWDYFPHLIILALTAILMLRCTKSEGTNSNVIEFNVCNRMLYIDEKHFVCYMGVDRGAIPIDCRIVRGCR